MTGSRGSHLRLALARPALRRLVAGYFAYSLARKGSRVAIVVAAFDSGGVAAAAGVAAAQLLPAALLAPFGSVVADRLGPARALTISYLLQALALALAGVALSVGLPIAVGAALAAAASAAFTLTRPVYLAVLPDAVESAEELTVGNALSVWGDGLASVLGPLLAGIGLVTVGSGPVLMALGGACLAAAAVSAGLRVHSARRARSTSALGTVAAGIRTVAGDSSTASLVGLVCAQYLAVGLLDVLLVVFAVDVLGGVSADTGTLTASIGIGAALGGIASFALVGRSALRPALLIGAAVGGLPVAALGLAPDLLTAALLIGWLGAGKSLVTVAAQTLHQRTVPDDLAPAVFGVQESGIQLATAAGSALAPLLLVALGPRGALTAAGLLVPVLALAVASSLRRLDRRAVVPGPVFALLRRVPFLAVLPLRTLEGLARAATERQVPGGQRVITEGDVGERYHLIEAGQAEVSIGGVRARTLGPGDGFGEIALLRDVPRTATVTARSDLSLVELDRVAFLAALTGTRPAAEAAEAAARHRLHEDSLRHQ